MSETMSDSLTLTMSHADLTVMAKAMENSVNSMQLEFAELEEQKIELKQDIERQLAMLSVMKSRLG